MTRWIELDGVVNMRDLGGLPTRDGRTTREGRLIRSDNLQDLSEGDVRHLVEVLGVTDVVDLRSHVEHEVTGAGPLRSTPLTHHHHSLLREDLDAGATVEEALAVRWGRENPAPRDGTFWARHYTGYLTRRPDSVAAALAAWREKIAESRNRPRKWILADDALYKLAERQPDSLAQLTALQVLPPKTIERHGNALLQVVAESRGSTAPALALDGLLSDAQKSLIQKLANRSREIATELGIPPSLLAPRADIEAVALQGPSARVPVLDGWRRQVAGEALLKLLP